MAQVDTQAKLQMSLKAKVLTLLVPLIIVLDQITKQVILSNYFLGESTPVIPGFFNITYVQNKGAAFGVFSQLPDVFRVPFFFIVPVIAVGILWSLYRKLPPQSFKTATGVALVLGGAIGNLIDRLIYGYVIDFLDFHWSDLYHFPAFNVADSGITVGIIILMLDLLFFNEIETENAA